MTSSVALQGAASKPAGTYNVRLACQETSGAPLTAMRANLSVLRLRRLGPAADGALSFAVALRRTLIYDSRVLARGERTVHHGRCGRLALTHSSDSGGIPTCLQRFARMRRSRTSSHSPLSSSPSAAPRTPPPRSTARRSRTTPFAASDIKNRTIRSKDIAKGVIGSTLQSSAAQAIRDAGPTNVGSSTNFTPVATLGGLEPGAYVLLAKVNQSANAFTEGRCRIQAEGDVDDSNRGLRPQGTPEGHNLQLVHSFAGTGTAVLACRAAVGTWTASDAKLLAIRISAARSSVVSG